MFHVVYCDGRRLPAMFCAHPISLELIVVLVLDFSGGVGI